jgi:hypothetical protein
MGGDDPDTKASISTSFPDIQRWRESISKRVLVGPQVIAARSIIDGPPGIWPGLRVVTNEQQARELVRAEKAAGSDFVKVYDLLRAPEFRALTGEARRQGLEVHGHLSAFVDVADAIRAGQRTIEHFAEGRYLVITSKGTDIAERYQDLFVSMPVSLTLEPSQIWRSWLTILKEAVESHDDGKAEELVRLRATSDSWQVLTWRVHRTMFLDSHLRKGDETLAKYVPAAVRQMWARHPYRSGIADDPELVALGDSVRWKDRELLNRMRKGRVRFLAGSDSGNPDLVPGFALHEELADLVDDAGFTPLEALQMATLRPAEFLGQLNQLGTIEAGKYADIVLLRANPLDDIRNTRAIEGVVVRGDYINRLKLNQMLGEVEAAIKD